MRTKAPRSSADGFTLLAWSKGVCGVGLRNINRRNQGLLAAKRVLTVDSGLWVEWRWSGVMVMGRKETMETRVLREGFPAV